MGKVSKVVCQDNLKFIEQAEKKTITSSNVLSGFNKFEYLQKRIVDYVIIIILGSVVWPVILYTIFRIKKESPGPIFFTQIRIGMNEKRFLCYKFRSMHVNSRFNPYTQENDSRIFPFGRLMRKMRIDELPQIINVLKGDMHIVGPRAEWDILVNDYSTKIHNYTKRHLVRPGITGLAQVTYPYGQNVDDARNKLKFDLLYIKKWSLLLEFKVIIKTIVIVLKRKGI